MCYCPTLIRASARTRGEEEKVRSESEMKDMRGERDLEKVQPRGSERQGERDEEKQSARKVERHWDAKGVRETDRKRKRSISLGDTCLFTPGCQSHRSLLLLLTQHPKQGRAAAIWPKYEAEEQLPSNSPQQRPNIECGCVCECVCEWVVASSTSQNEL